jgi:hypothetical protein
LAGAELARVKGARVEFSENFHLGSFCRGVRTQRLLCVGNIIA